MSVRIIRPGLLSSLQDRGRPGYAQIGVGRAGAMDMPAWRLANALVGNRGDEAAIECTLLGPTLRFDEAAWIALCGAPMTAQVGAEPLPSWTACHLPAGGVLRLERATVGCRSYLAVRGGFDVAPVMGSRSTDLHAGLRHAGGRALQVGDMLTVGRSTPMALPSRPGGPGSLPWSLDPQPWFDFARRPLALLPGSHLQTLDPDSEALLYTASFTVSPSSNRTASRLDGHTLHLRKPLELVSEAALPGTVQLPPSGQPIVLMAEAPVTGGYPRIGQVAAVDLPRLAQRRPGDTLAFRRATLDECLARLAEREVQLQRLLRRIARRLEQAP